MSKPYIYFNVRIVNCNQDHQGLFNVPFCPDIKIGKDCLWNTIICTEAQFLGKPWSRNQSYYYSQNELMEYGLKIWKLTFADIGMVHSNSDSKYDKTTACAWMDDGWHKFLQARENILHVKPDTDTQKANVEPYTAPIYLAKFLYCANKINSLWWYIPWESFRVLVLAKESYASQNSK